MLDGVSEHRWAVAIQRGFLLCLPLVIIGVIALVIGGISFPAGVGGQILTDVRILCAHVVDVSFGIIALCLVVTTSYSLASQHNVGGHRELPPIVAAIVALISFMVIATPADGKLGVDLFGKYYVLPAILSSIASTELLLMLMRIHRLHFLHAFNDADPLFQDLLRSIIPSIITVAVFLFFQRMLGWWGLPIASLVSESVDTLFQPIESPLLRALLFNVLNQLLWFVGAHGNNILSAAEQHYLMAATAANAAAISAGHTPTEIVTKPFLDVFVFMGGSGTSLGLIIAILLNWRSSNQGRLARLSLLPAMFNVSELIVFGLPIVFNPVFLIPFIMTPLVLVLTSYAACVVGFIAPISQPVSWTTPPLLGGYLATGTWRGISMQLFNLLVAVLIYRPFVLVARRQFEETRRRKFGKLIVALEDFVQTHGRRVFAQNTSIGSLARQLAGDLTRDVKLGCLRLVYQPQVDNKGIVVGVEALLRWNHELLGAVPPHITVMIAEEADLICPLGDWIIETACRQHRQWQQMGVSNVRMSINVSPTQFSSPGFVGRVGSVLTRYDLDACDIEFEITEGRAVTRDDLTVLAMKNLAAMGIKFAIDDFGMGHSSLLYMRRFSIHAIKLDGSLTRDVLTHSTCQEIIEAIANLCRNRNMQLIAEYVETEDQRDLLNQLGCNEFQGYLYSKPLEADELPAFFSMNAGSRCEKEIMGV